MELSLELDRIIINNIDQEGNVVNIKDAGVVYFHKPTEQEVKFAQERMFVSLMSENGVLAELVKKTLPDKEKELIREDQIGEFVDRSRDICCLFFDNHYHHSENCILPGKNGDKISVDEAPGNYDIPGMNKQIKKPFDCFSPGEKINMMKAKYFPERAAHCNDLQLRLEFAGLSFTEFHSELVRMNFESLKEIDESTKSVRPASSGKSVKKQSKKQKVLDLVST